MESWFRYSLIRNDLLPIPFEFKPLNDCGYCIVPPVLIQDDQKFSVQFFCLWGAMKNSMYSNSPHTIDDLKMAVTEYIRNVDRAILNTVFENTVRRVNFFFVKIYLQDVNSHTSVPDSTKIVPSQPIYLQNTRCARGSRCYLVR
jgi:hypothetical protein